MTSLLLIQHGGTLAKRNVPTGTLLAGFIERSARNVEIRAFSQEFHDDLARIPDFDFKIMWCRSAHERLIHHPERKRNIQ